LWRRTSLRRQPRWLKGIQVELDTLLGRANRAALADILATHLPTIDARFIESNVYDLPAALSGRFDIVFCSYGVLCWLPDLKRWGEIVASYLEPGGIFYIAEAHPFIRVFPMDNDITDGSTELRPYFPYFHDPAGTRWEPDADYADAAVQSIYAGTNEIMKVIIARRMGLDSRRQ